MGHVYSRGRAELDHYLDRWGQLFVCVIADMLGVATYVIPGLGELADIIYAPVEAGIIYLMLSNDRQVAWFAGIGFTEEILPFTDIVPMCTIAWAYKYWK